MKNDAESKGAEEAPISGTLGTESGRGVVSMRISWLNLRGEGLVVMLDLGEELGITEAVLRTSWGEWEGSMGLGECGGGGGWWWELELERL